MVALQLFLSYGVDCIFLHDVCHVSDVLVPSFATMGLIVMLMTTIGLGMVFVGRRWFMRGNVKFGVHCVSKLKA